MAAPPLPVKRIHRPGVKCSLIQTVSVLLKLKETERLGSFILS